MDFVELTTHLVKSVVREPDMVAVKQFTDSDGTIIIEVLVNESDMGAVIGKGGIIANAIRTIVQAASYINGNAKVKINIDSF